MGGTRASPSGPFSSVSSFPSFSLLLLSILIPVLILSSSLVAASPSNPVQVAFYQNTTSLSYPMSVFPSGNYLYVVTNNGNLTTFDIAGSNASNPRQVASYRNATSLTTPIHVFVNGDYLYVGVSSYLTLTTFDIAGSNASDPRQVAYYSNSSAGSLESIFASGNYLYVLTYGKLLTFDIAGSNASYPRMVASYTNTTSLNSSNQPIHMFVSDNYLYIPSVSGDSLTTFDIAGSNASDPRQVAFYANATSLNGSYSVFAAGNYAYVTSINGNSLTTFDIAGSNASDPRQVDFYVNVTGLNASFNLFVSNGYAYVVSTSGHSLTTFDVSGSNASNPRQVAFYANATSINNPYSDYAYGNYLYVVAPFSFGLATFDISPPSSPFSCSFRTSCAGNATEQGLLRARNDTGGYDDAHAQLMNYTGTAYNDTLCCDTDENHTLDNSCANPNATTVLRLYDVTNNHVQVPGVDYASYGHPLYNYTACMALSPGNLTCVYVNSTCPANYTGIASVASSEPNDGLYNLTNAHVAAYGYYALSVCCKNANTPPTVPVLTYPTDNNYSVFERNVTFQWNPSTDADGDPVTYDFNLTQATCPGYAAAALSATSYLPASELCVDQPYNWTVRACDPYACSAWASPWNFTIASVAGLTFLTNNTNFGVLNNNDTRNTTAGSPPPFLVENTGNVPLNVTFEATTPLYASVGLGNDSFQYAARANESSSYGSAQTAWTNVSATYTPLFTDLNYAAGLNEASIDILVRVPGQEGAGAKTSTVQVQGNYTG